MASQSTQIFCGGPQTPLDVHVLSTPHTHMLGELCFPPPPPPPPPKKKFILDETLVSYGSLIVDTMMVPLAGSVGEDDLHAAVGGVVGSLALLPVAVPHVVGVLLVKLQKKGKEVLMMLERSAYLAQSVLYLSQVCLRNPSKVRNL